GGKIKLNDKNQFTKFITIGALSENRKSTKLLINAAKELLVKGVTNFKITVIGKVNIQDLPSQLQGFFDIKGRLDFV
ncbi:glycosyltransferase family 4 protein, partial [Francisella tularensis subsp. holarctica]|nr:glycosyltransferase family 4 protein [Francisella tularensis subsp. holarctica]